MSRSPAISALLILAVCIVSNVLSAPTEEMIRKESEREEFLETREAEISVRQPRASRSERFDISREEEILHRGERLVEKPSATDDNKSDIKATETKKAPKQNESKNDSQKKAENSEAKDMTQTHVDPKDDDESTADSATAPSKVPENTKKDCSGVEMPANKNSTDAPNEFPDDDTVKSPNDKPEMYSVLTHNKTRTGDNNDATATTIAPVVSTEAATNPPASSSSTISTTPLVVATEKTTVATSSTVSTVITEATTISTSTPTTTTTTSEKPAVTSQATESTSAISTVTAEAAKSTEAATTTETTTEKSTTMTISSSTNSDVITDKPMPIGSTEMSQAEKDLHSKKPREEEKRASMPSGIVALITAIAFAIVAVMAYIGLVTWRRYLEWRYGNRELLVNEFDSNDIGNFEL